MKMPLRTSSRIVKSIGLSRKPGKYKLDKDTLSSMCDAHPELLDFKELRKTLVDREIKITYGSDYRIAVR